MDIRTVNDWKRKEWEVHHFPAKNCVPMILSEPPLSHSIVFTLTFVWSTVSALLSTKWFGHVKFKFNTMLTEIYFYDLMFYNQHSLTSKTEQKWRVSIQISTFIEINLAPQIIGRNTHHCLSLGLL